LGFERAEAAPRIVRPIELKKDMVGRVGGRVLVVVLPLQVVSGAVRRLIEGLAASDSLCELRTETLCANPVRRMWILAD